ncbi:MAG TPA: ester cyclase [Ktedonobacteraceae bacterium]|nr:ester cyclase [Ktedonobacteraceae bacterium]
MSTESNKAVTHQFLEELFNKRNLAIVDALCVTNVVNHGLGPEASGIERTKRSAGMYLAAFPDLHFAFEDYIAEGDQVVVRWTSTGTHKGELMGIPPTGKQFSATGIEIYRFEGGKIVEHWLASDQLGMLQQLGVVPAPAQVG